MGKRVTRTRQPSAVVSAEPGLLARYRVVLIAAAVVVAVAAVGFVLLRSATASAYSCEALLQAPPGQTTWTLEDFGDAPLGFPVADDGRDHSNGSTSYASCPPTSGEHRAQGELARDFYGPQAEQVPNDWVHNLEHGYAVIAYAGDPGEDILAGVQAAMDAAVPTEVARTCGLPNKVMALRFDQMSEPFAVLAWERALLMSEFDPDLATAAAERFQDRPEAPERAC